MTQINTVATITEPGITQRIAESENIQKATCLDINQSTTEPGIKVFSTDQNNETIELLPPFISLDDIFLNSGNLFFYTIVFVLENSDKF